MINENKENLARTLHRLGLGELPSILGVNVRVLEYGGRMCVIQNLSNRHVYIGQPGSSEDQIRSTGLTLLPKQTIQLDALASNFKLVGPR